MSEAVDLIKEAALEAVEAEKPVQMVFGVVTSAQPLEIQTEQKLILPEDVLSLADPVRDKTIVIHRSLKEGEKVMLQRIQGGQRYIVMDRVDDAFMDGDVTDDI
jgi:hypothetical protein